MVYKADILNHMGLYCGCQWLGYKRRRAITLRQVADNYFLNKLLNFYKIYFISFCTFTALFFLFVYLLLENLELAVG